MILVPARNDRQEPIGTVYVLRAERDFLAFQVSRRIYVDYLNPAAADKRMQPILHGAQKMCTHELFEKQSFKKPYQIQNCKDELT